MPLGSHRVVSYPVNLLVATSLERPHLVLGVLARRIAPEQVLVPAIILTPQFPVAAMIYDQIELEGHDGALPPST